MRSRASGRGQAVVRRLLEARALAPLAADKPERASAPLAKLWPARRALLIINSKSGPQHDSLLRVRDLVDLLLEFGIRADVQVKLHKSQARKQARAAAKKGRYDVVIAAGGDGTVESVASGLIGASTPLGIIPLGTFNNVANSLHVPMDVRQACALIALGVPRRIDVGVVMARYMKRPKIFLEISSVGLGAIVGSFGQNVEKARWDQAAQTLPALVDMSPAPMRLRVNGQSEPDTVSSLLVTVSNTPRAGAGLQLAPGALLDDGELDVSVFVDMDQTALLAAFFPQPPGEQDTSDRIRRFRVQRLDIDAARPMPVSIESKIVGVTPVRYTVVPRALQVIVGDAPALLHPQAADLVQASVVAAQVPRPAEQAAVSDRWRSTEPLSPVVSAAQSLVPVVGGALESASSARQFAAPLAAAAAGFVAAVLLRRRERRR